MHDNTFIIFFHHSERNWLEEYLPYWYVKSQGCFVTYWLPMTSVLFGIVRICRPPFQMPLSWKPKTFYHFFSYFWNLHQVLNISKNKMIVIATLLRKLQAKEDLVRPLYKKHRLRKPFDSQHVKESQTFVKSAWEHFHHIFNHSERNWLEKYLPQWYVKS